MKNKPTVRFNFDTSLTRKKDDESTTEPYLIRHHDDVDRQPSHFTFENTTFITVPSDEQHPYFRPWVIRLIERGKNISLSRTTASIRKFILRNYLAVTETLLSTDNQRRDQDSYSVRNGFQDDIRAASKGFDGEKSDDHTSDYCSINDEDKSLGAKTYHSVLWEDVSVGYSGEDDNGNTGIRLITKHTTRITDQKMKSGYWLLFRTMCSLDLSTSYGQFVLELLGILQLAYSLLFFQILCVYQKQCKHFGSTEDAAVIMPKAAQRGTPILAATHAILSTGILMYGVPWFIVSMKRKAVQSSAKSSKIFQLTRYLIIIYFITCALTHMILGCFQCLVMSHGKTFYVETILYQLQKQRDGGINSSIFPIHNTTRVPQYWMDRDISAKSIFCYGLTSSVYDQNSINRLASKQMMNEWSRLLLNVGMCLLDLGSALLLIRSWRPINAVEGIRLEEMSPSKEKV